MGNCLDGLIGSDKAGAGKSTSDSREEEENLKEVKKVKKVKNTKDTVESSGDDQDALGDGGAEEEGEVLPEIEVKKLGAEDIKKATNKFAKANFLGKGPTGEVYKGSLDGKDVAFKRLLSNSLTVDDFLEEVELVKKFRHKNVVPLLAYCPVAGHRALAFDFTPLGSLSDLLHGPKDGPPPSVALTWAQRLKILKGAAGGLKYLHDDVGDEASGTEGLVHKRIKASNVLVFPGFVGKICDCKLQAQDQDSILPDSSNLLGNFAIEAPECITGELNQKSDVFSFGVVMLETLSGKRPMEGIASASGGRPTSVKEWALGNIANQNFSEIVDPRMSKDGLQEKALAKFCKLIVTCLEHEPQQRPPMKIVEGYLAKLQ